MGKQKSVIVIIVKNNTETKKLYALGLQFGEAIKVVEKYQKVGPDLVYIICCHIRHQRMKNCEDRSSKYIIYTGPHKVEDHQYRVTEYYIKK